MPDLEIWLVIQTFAGLILGAMGILWVRAGSGEIRLSWGHGLFISAFLSLGASSLVAAFHRADGLVGVGLTAGLLVVGMLWEGPRPLTQGQSISR